MQSYLITILLVVSVLSVSNLNGQASTNTFIKVSIVNYKQNITKEFIINKNDNEIKYQKGKKIKTTRVKNLFLSDSCDYEKLKEICLSNINDSLKNLCEYHLEKGYYRIEIIQSKYEVKYYSESFVIHLPYRCTKSEYETLIRKTLAAIELVFDEIEN